MNLPISPPIAVTPVAGQPLLVSVEARGTLIKSGGGSCSIIVFPVVNGSPLLSGELVQLSAPTGAPLFPGGVPVGAMTFPLGVAQPGVPQNVSLLSFSTSSGCAAGSRIDQVAVVVTEEK